MRMMPIASGSSGNCIYVGSDNTHILIDAGISRKKILLLVSCVTNPRDRELPTLTLLGKILGGTSYAAVLDE